MELESPDVSSEQSELEVNSSEEVESSSEELASDVEASSEELTSDVEASSEESTSDMEVDEIEITETTTEIIYQTSYSSNDLIGIETCLQFIICLLFVIVIYIVCKICRSILDILGF